MGQSHSSHPPREVPIEQLSHDLALRFASKCYTHLEIAHFKDNFKSLADHQDDLEYWKEDTLCRFLCLPESLRAGPVIYQMCSYLGAFPFPGLAPCILTREAMVKIVTLLTGRYKKVLKRGSQDKVKLLFRSLAVFDRRASTVTSAEKPRMKDLVAQQKPEYMLEEEAVAKGTTGFAVDEPANDDEEEDEDDLALAALDALDAIEVFQHDQKADRKINHALIPTENLKRLIMLLLLFGNLDSQSNISSYGDDLNQAKIKALDEAASAMIATFEPDPISKGIRYSNFVKTVSITMPNLFEPLNALFEHFLFSKNIDLSKHRNAPHLASPGVIMKHSPIYRKPEDTTSSILSDTTLSQLATSLKLITPTSTLVNVYQSGARFNQIYSTASNGTSLSSFSRQVLSWESGTIILVSGTPTDQASLSSSSSSSPILLGAYLPTPWRDSSSSFSPPPSTADPQSKSASMFLLSPHLAVFPANPYSNSTSVPQSHFSSKTGLALGCVIPASSRTTTHQPILGPVSLLVDDDFSTAIFQHDPTAGQGAFVTDPTLESAQLHHQSDPSTIAHKVEFDIDALEVWGVSFPSSSSSANNDDDDNDDEVTKQQKRLAWEEAEAARRRGVNFGGDKDGARALLEMAGLVGDQAGNRSGGSV